MDVAAFSRLVSVKMKAAIEFYLENNRWPHQYSTTCGQTFVDQVADNSFFAPDPRFIAYGLLDGRELLSRYQVNHEGLKKDQRQAVRSLQFTYPRKLVHISRARIYDFLREMYDRCRENKIVMTVQCRREEGDLFPMFFDIDEHVDDPAKFVATDRYVEGVVASLMDMIYPDVKWWWARPTHVRRSNKPYPNGFQGGVHIHTEAITDVTGALVVAEWFHTYMGPYVTDEYAHVKLDRGVYNKAACFRPMFSYKSYYCEAKMLRGKPGCNADCLSCLGRKEVVTGPPCVFAPHAETYENFLFSTMFIPDGATCTPCAPAIEASISLQRDYPKQKRSLAVIMRSHGSYERYQQNGTTTAVLSELNQNAVLRIVAEYGQHGKNMEDYGVPYFLPEGAIVVPCLSRICVFMTAVLRAANPGKRVPRHEHKSNSNFYVLSTNGALFLRCRSRTNVACYETKPPPIYEVTDEEYELIFNRARDALTDAMPDRTTVFRPVHEVPPTPAQKRVWTEEEEVAHWKRFKAQMEDFIGLEGGF